MEPNQDVSLFGLNIDSTGKSNLAEAARWAKFLAILGMVMCGLIIIFGIIAATAISNISDFQREFGGRRYYDTGGLGISMMVSYILIAVIYFFPCLFTLRFSTYMQNAIRADDQASLNESFKNLKITFRYMGIITIIFMVLFLLGLLVGGLGAALGN